MQKHPLEPERPHGLVERRIPVLVVPGDRMAGMHGVDADLVRPACLDVGFDQRCRGSEEMYRPKDAHRGLATALHNPHGAFASHPMIDLEGGLDPFLAQLPTTPNEREIALLEAALADQLVERSQGAAALRHDQAAARISIEAVNKLELLLGSQRTQRLYDAETDSAAAVNGNTGRLVEDDDPLILAQEGRLDAPEQIRAHAPRRRGFLDPDRWDTNPVAQAQAQLGRHPAAIHPHFSLSDKALNAAARDPRKHVHQEAVQAVSGLLCPNLQVSDLCSRAHLRCCFYNKLVSILLRAAPNGRTNVEAAESRLRVVDSGFGVIVRADKVAALALSQKAPECAVG